MLYLKTSARHSAQFRTAFTPLMLIFCLWLSACGGTSVDDSSGESNELPTEQTPEPETPTEQPEEPEAPADLYNTGLFLKEQVLQVSVTMVSADWNAMRNEGPTVAGCHAADYTDYLATVTIDGETNNDVTISKKGGLGSQSATRPSIKLNFGKGDEFDGRTYQGDKRITLNNNRQDTTNVKQCLAYFIYNLAGIHSPRCNFAEVELQGSDVGVYTHVEAIKKPFLAWRFGDDSGNLYETQRDGEFTALRAPLFQKKTNEGEADFSDMIAVADALALPVATRLDAVAQLVNVQAFARFAIMEALIGQIDGYTSNQNNTYIYHNPSDDLIYFIPWGADITFTRRHLREAGAEVPNSIFLGSVLIQKLWEVEAFRTLYDNEVRDILDNAWNETDIIAELNRMAAIIGTSNSDVNTISQFILNKRALVAAELAGTASRAWKWDLMADDYCISE